MKEFVLVFLWFISGIAAKHEVHLVPAHILCPNVSKDHDILIPDPNDCSVYYRCENGSAIPQSCPIGLEWCKILSECTLPILANCTIKHTVVTYSPEELATYKPSGTHKPPQTPSPTHDICLINGARIPDYSKCDWYYECKNHTPVNIHCLPKKSYSCWYGSCVDQKHADCILEGSQEGKKCAKNGAKLGHPDDCTKYYVCENKKVVTKSCESGLEFNPWFLNCYEPNLAYCNKGTTIEPTTPTIGTTPTASPIDDICPIPGATLPDFSNCKAYYQCENDRPVLHECPAGLEYSCWDQECLSPVISECANSIQENDTCTGNGTKLAIPDECNTYFVCKNGVIQKENCDHTLEYNQWFKQCLHPDLAHCKQNLTTTTTEPATSTPPPSPTDDICPIDGAKLPNIFECNSYYLCKGEKPYIQYCPDGYEYSCWDQECLPDESANCISQNNQTGQPCNNNGDKLPHPNICSSYYQCIDEKIEIQYCKNNLEYNQWYGSCMKPSLAHCNRNDSETTSTEPETTSSTEPEPTSSTGSNPTETEPSTSPSNGISESESPTTTGTSSSTEPETTSSQSSSGTSKPPQTPSPTHDICLINGARIPDYSKCDWYYECKNHTPVNIHCLPKKSYSCWYGSCVDQKHADCILEGSQEGKKCAKNGAKLGHPDDCTKYYVCENKKVVTKSCESGLEFNPWFLNCYEPNLAYCNKGTTIEPTTPTIGTTPTASPIDDICPIPGATLPDFSNCKAYYQCENDRPVLHECPAGLEYSCWDQECLSPVISECANSIQENDTCTGNGTKLAIPDECNTYFVCKNGVIQKENCDHTLEYNQWFKQCLHPDLAHCKQNLTTTTTEPATSTPPPSPTDDICPIDGAKLPNIFECNSYYLCKGEKPYIQYCPDGYEYSCWDQECLPDESANCISQNNQTGQPCNNNGDKLPHPNICSSYYQCIDGKIEIQYCKNNLEYNQWYGSCMKPSLAHCNRNDSETTSTEPETTSSTEPEPTSSTGSNPTETEPSTSPSSESESPTTTGTSSATEPETTSSQSSSGTSKPPQTPSPTHDICLINGARIPDYSKCDWYYECKNHTPVNIHCLPKKSYSCWYGSCVDQKHADCILEGSQEGKKCAKNGAKLGHPDDCTKYYVCENKKVVTKSCESGLEFNPWFLNCYEPNLAYCNKGTTIEPTTPTIGTTPTASPIDDICPIPGATLPDFSNCKAYYQCENDRPVLHECPAGLEYSCWDQECLSPVISECANSIQENDTCTGNGTKLAIPDECNTYFVCKNGVIQKENCDHTLEYNQWFKQCLHPDLAHCKQNLTTTTTEPATSTPPPSPTDDICPIDGAKLPNIFECNSYYLCKGEKPYIQYCPDGYEYSCWDQECLPDESANCISQNNQTGQPCNNNGDKLPHPNICSSYYQCIDGKIEIQYCKNNLEYNQWYGSCMKPSLAHCNRNDSETTSTEPETTSSTEPEPTSSTGSNPTETEPSTSPSSESESPTTTGTSSATEPETTSSQSSSGTSKPPQTPSPTHDICLINGARIPDYSKCDWYYECKNHTPVNIHCLPKKSYSCWYGSCVDQKHADCILEGSQEGKKCAKNGAKLGHPDDCTKYYVCENKKVVTKSCESGLEFNPWFLNCYEPNLAYCNKGTTIEPTTPTIGTTPTASPIDDICPIPGATLPDFSNCKAYYQCENDRPVLHECPAGLEYSCWDQECLSPVISECANSIQENDTCTGNGTKLAIPDECNTYFVCKNGVIQKENCDHTLEYNQWFKQCLHPDLAHCKQNLTTTTTEPATSTPPPSPTDDICPIDGAKLPNIFECNSYYLCKGEKPYIQYCPDGYEYSCWDQECLPDESANCISQNNQTGQPCNNNGDKLPHPNICSSYYQCIDGKIEIQYCKNNLEYNQWYGSCMKPSLAHCNRNDSETTSTEPETTSSTEPEPTSSTGSNPTETEPSTSPSSESESPTTTGTSSSTEPETTSSQSSSGTSKPPQTPSPTHDICLINGARIPDYSKCDWYYECKNHTPVNIHCLPKKSYSCWYGSCVDQKHADCILEGSQEGKKCAKNGAKLGHPDDCTKYYVCENKKVVTKSCESGLEFNPWFLNCYEPNLAYCNKGTTIEPTTPTIGTTPTASPIDDICPIPGATLPDFSNCKAYYQCENDRPVLHECPAGLEYSCWDQECLSPVISECANSIQENDTCTGNGTKLAIPDECNTYFVCKNGVIQKENCDHTLEYNQWFKQCLHPDLAHCKQNLTTTTTEPATSTPPPSPTDDICPIDGAKLPNIFECNSYYLCKGEKPYIQYCPDGYEYSCWDQECLPDESANCISQNNQTGQPCNNNGDKLPHPNICSSYYQCIDGKIEIQYCKNNLEYNQWYGSCMKPSLAHCNRNDSETTSTEPETTSSTEPEPTSSTGSNPTETEPSTSPSSESESPTTTGTSSSTEPETTSSQSSSGTSKPPQTPSPTHDICLINGARIPDYSKCDWYYECKNHTPVNIHCLPKKSYSCWYGSCVDQKHADCILEGSQEGKKCAKNGAKLGHPDDCTKYYVCENKKVVTKSCESGLEFNPWFLNCYEPNLAYCNKGTTIEPTTPTIGTTPTASPIDDICPIPGATLPDFSNCKAYYQCENDRPVLHECPAGLEYSCWDQECLSPVISECANSIQENDTCTGNGTKLAIPDECNTYFVCKNGVIQKENCDHTLEYNQWFKQCLHPDLAHCKQNLTTTTTEPATSTPPPSPTDDICPIDGAKLPNIFECNSYYLCKGEKPYIQYCPDGYEYSCWDQECLPDESANCISQNNQTGQPCNNNGDKLPHPNICSSYYQCIDGKIEIQYCKNNLEYNQWYGSCMKPSLAHCNRNDSETTSTEPETTSSSGSNPTGIEPNTSTSIATDETGLPTTTSGPSLTEICPQNDVALPNPTNCSLFYQCVNGTPTAKQCNTSEEFSSWLGQCVDTTTAICIGEGSIEGKLCSVNGKKLQYPQNCGKYYECVNNSAVLKSCPIGDEFNIWFGACYEPKFAHCHNYSEIHTTSSTEGTTITLSPIINICTENGSLLPNLLDCRLYYECQNNNPVEKMCPENLYYSCWDLQCLPKSLAHCFNEPNITDKCSDDNRIPNPNNCYSYFECKHGKPILHYCKKGLEYNAWNKKCVLPSLSHCVSNNTSTTTTTGKPSSTPPPSKTHDICPIDGSNLPNLQDCGSYYQCQNHKAELKNCTSGYIYSCWDQVCLPALTANCLNKDTEEGQACPTEGEKLPNAKNCSTFYQCVSRKVQLISCEPGLEFNSWYQKCTSTSLAWCHTYPPIGSGTTDSGTTESTSSTLSSNISPSPMFNICPINGATLPNALDCKSYYVCQDQLPVPKQCPKKLAYDCWEQKCTAEEAATCINKGNQTGHSCSNNGDKLPNTNSCTSYYQCVNSIVHIKFCADGQLFNEWFGICVEHSLAHCQMNSTSTTSNGSTEGTTITPSTGYEICPINNALLPSPGDCSTYYRCEKNIPVLQTCELGFAYSCWDQKCVPASDADCIAEGSQEDKKCSTEGQLLPNIEYCNKYYECKNGKVKTKQCLPGTQFNQWFKICLPKSLAHCEPHSTLPPRTTSHPLTTVTPSPTDDICPINGSLLPNPRNCSSYYICENGNPTIHYCDKGLEYSCWDQLCLPPSKADCIAVGPQTGKNCSKEGQKTQNPDNCHTYYQCVNGNVETKFCPTNFYYNKWFRICFPSILLSHCKIDPPQTTPKTTITTIATTTPAPSERVDICPIEGALLPAPTNCNAYYKCVNQSALIQHCPTNEEYSCWDQICKPASDAECINSGKQVGKKCTKEGEKIQDPATCSSYYQCLNGVVERQYCFLGFRYNKWYGHCVLFFLSHCETYPPSTEPTTEHTMTTSGSENTPSPSPIKDICPMENALLPNPANCSTYYRCQNNTPILQLCSDGQEYSCWDQTCLPTKDAHCIAVGSQEGLDCSREGERLPNIENCYSYFQCRKGKVVKQYCAPLLQYNKWYSECKIPKYAHCQTFSTKPTKTTTTTTTTGPITTYKPPTSVVCQTNGAKVPNPKNCKQYFVCDKGSPVLYECPPGYSYDCWNEACNPTRIARCVSAESAYVGDKCTPNGRTIPNVSNCNKYYECVKGKIAEKKCRFLQQYSVWGSNCTLIGLAKCANNAFLGII